MRKPPKKTLTSKPVKPVKRPVGSPPKYAIWMNEVARRLANEGRIDSEIYKILGIAEATGISYKKKYPDFLKALNEGKRNINKEVENRLLDLALGYEYDAEKIVVVSDGGNMGSHWERVPTIERLHPNLGAIKEWQWNRNPERWKNKVDIEHSGNVSYRVIPDDMEDAKEY